MNREKNWETRRRLFRLSPLGFLAALGTLLSFSPVLLAQTTGQKAPAARAKQSVADPHDLSGVWMRENGVVPCTIVGAPPDQKCSVGNGAVPIAGLEMTPWAHDLMMSQDGGKGTSGNADPNQRCDPLGFPRDLLEFIHPFEIVQTPDKTWMIFEETHMWRVIYTDGQPMPKVEDLPFGNTWLGYSVGHWEGDDFIVETIGMNDKTWLDRRGHVHSDQLRLTDRYHRVGDVLEVSFTYDDPKAYTKVWTLGPQKYDLKTGPEWKIQESFCTIEDEGNFEKNVTDPAASGINAPITKPK